jgi:hypothetical protein
MKKSAMMLLVLALVSCQSATDKIKKEEAMANDPAMVDGQGTPVFAFEKDFHDFGDITDGDQPTYDFKFKNTGNAPLIITSANGSCGCTVPDYPRTPIAPGDEGVIKVSFNSSGRQGKQDKQVTITSNCVPNTTILKITSNVLPKAEAAQ